MKLFYSATSPFVRKVVATAIVAGLDDRIERVTTNPWESPPDLLAQNPLAKVPCLLVGDGMSLIESSVICAYLASLAGETELLPLGGPGRWRVLRQEAIADGILDAAVICRMEGTRPEEEARRKNVERQQAAMRNGLQALEADPPGDTLDIGAIAVACALGYLDFRFAGQPWREAHPKLAAWYARAADLPAIKDTAPPPG